MIEAKTFFTTAKADLRAAALLFDHKEYPNAIYHIQQATEKLAKSFGLLNRWLKPNEKDIKSVGHNSKTIFTDALNAQANAFEQARSVIHYFPRITLPPAANLSGPEEKLLDGVQRTAIKLNNLQSGDFIDIDDDELDNILTIITKIGKAADQVVEMVVPFFPRLMASKLADKLAASEISKEVYENALKQIQDTDLIDETFHELAPAMPYILQTHTTLLLFSFVTAAHNQVTRYPTEEFTITPQEVYTADHLLIRRFPELYNLLIHASTSIELLFFVDEASKET